MPGPSYGFKAGGNILPARFVIMSGSNTVTQASTGEKVIGVSQRGTRNAPYSSLDDTYAAIAGESLNVYTEGDVCGLMLGGTVTYGDFLKSDSAGRGVASSADQEKYGARALKSGTVGEIIEVEVITGERSTA